MTLDEPNNCVQATPDYARFEFVRQEPGAPDADRRLNLGCESNLMAFSETRRTYV